MELGSEFDLCVEELSYSESNLLSRLEKRQSATYLDSGRSAIRLALSMLHTINMVLLPEFICESVIKCFLGYRIQFYSINNDLSIDVEKLISTQISPNSIIFVAHYFGKRHDDTVMNMIYEYAKKNNSIVMEDITQSLLSENVGHAQFIVGSIRKWFAIPNGGVLLARGDLGSKTNVNMGAFDEGSNEKAYAMILKHLFLNGVLECNSQYRDIFTKCEMEYDANTRIRKMSDLAGYLIKCYNVGKIIQIRRDNFEYLYKNLKDRGIVPIVVPTEEDCPFTFTIRMPNRDMFRKYLTERKIYCAVHWPVDNVMIEERRMAKYNADTLISLPIDQRYGKRELDYMLDVIDDYGGALTF